MYYRALQRALGNKRNFHLCAILWRGKSIIRIGINRDKTHPKALRRFLNGQEVAHLHAEMDALIASQPGDVLEVLRIKKKSQTLTMAKPCKVCQKWITRSGISKVRYTNWDGIWQDL